MATFCFLMCAMLAAALLGEGQADNSKTCGERPFAGTNNAEDRIVNGDEAIPGDWGWQVSLMNYGQHFCGGVLINSQWVLTAGHCFQQMPSGLAIDLGLHDRNNKESWTVKRKAEKVIVHPQFDIRRMRNDIALIKLSAPVTLDNKYIIEACLPDAELDVQGKTCWVTGWGAPTFGSTTTTKLYEVSMPLLTDTRCRQRYGTMVNSKSTICAGEFDVNSGACQGDSGGPAVVQGPDRKWYVVGLTSWGQNGCGYGTVFTRVSAYLDWIAENIAANS